MKKKWYFHLILVYPPLSGTVELDHLREVNNLYSAQEGMTVSRSVYGKAPKRHLHSTPMAVSGSGYTGN